MEYQILDILMEYQNLAILMEYRSLAIVMEYQILAILICIMTNLQVLMMAVLDAGEMKDNGIS